MKIVNETYRIDKALIIENRIRVRLMLFGIMVGLYILFLTLSILSKDGSDAIGITNYMFLAIFIFAILVCLFFSSRAERTVIVITENSIKRIIDGETTHTIPLHEIGELRDFSRGFVIVKKGTPISNTFFRRSNFEHFDFPGLIYVPEIIKGYWDIHNFVTNTLKSRKA